ncbi:MAG: hypothetical protein M3141_03360 [Actinomycetota bacterium]|nr:hypothetical protein [Actinomycetota bacterium]
MATIVDTKVLAELVGAALLGGIGVTGIFGLVIYGSTRFADLRRQGNVVGAAFFGLVAGLALAAFAGGVVLALLIMTDK